MASPSALNQLSSQHVHLPKRDYCTLHFLQSILREDKLCLQKGEARRYKVPNLPELSVKKMWKEFSVVPDFLAHMPDEWKDGKRVDRTFFWTVMITLQPAFVDALVEDCRQQRKAARKGRGSCKP